MTGPGADHELDFAELVAAVEAVQAMHRHEVRGHLGTIRNATYFLRRRRADETALDERVERSLEMIERAVAALEVSSMDRGRAATRPEDEPATSVETAVDRARRACRRGPADAIAVALEPAQVAVAPELLAVAVRAVVENAIEAAGTGSRVRVHGASGAGGYVIAVEDSGPGFSLEAGEAVRPLTTTRTGSAGLGLAIARWVCREAGGRLEIPPVETGARVELVVPVRKR